MDDQNTEYEEYEDYEALHDELFALLDQHRMKALSQKLNEMNEFDISEFLGELWEDNPQRMAMVRSWPRVRTRYSALIACTAKLMSMISAGCPSPAARFTRRPCAMT